MSRTLKDKHWKLRFRDWHAGYDGSLKIAGYWPKLKKETDSEWNWLQATPSWWNNLFHTRPIRRKFKNFGTKVVGMDLEVIEEILEPSDSRRPHKYYY